MDATPSTTTYSLAGNQGNSNWWISNVAVTLSALDDLSEVETTYYRIDEGIWQTYVEPFVISDDDIHSLEYYSVDAAGNEEEVKTLEIKIDQTSPEITTLKVTPEVLWPPNHKLIEVKVTMAAADVVDSSPTIQLISVTSNEPDDGRRDGKTTGDIQGAEIGTFDTSLLLRAERSGKGTGRIYTTTYQATDEAGNSSEKSVNVTVPHDMSRKK